MLEKLGCFVQRPTQKGVFTMGFNTNSTSKWIKNNFLKNIFAA